MKDYTRETRQIMGYLGFNKLTYDMDAVDECHRLLLKADSRHDLDKGALGTVRMSYIRNGCLSYLRKMRGVKYKFHRGMFPIVKEKRGRGMRGNTDITESSIPFDKEEHLDVDGDLLLIYIRKCSILSKKEKDVIYDRYVNELSLAELATKYKTRKTIIGGCIYRALVKIKKNNTKDTFIC